jgi:prepilin-type N-terminal cleavage/methylation domain-containing protein
MISHPYRIPGREAQGGWRNANGYTLVEIAVSLAILGLLAAASTAAYVGTFTGNRTKLTSDASLATLSEAVIAFAKTYHRLPCPDLTGTGSEGLVAGVCPPAAEVGWFPYLSMGLTQPAPIARALYGVYRAPNANVALDADLATATEHGGDSAGSPTYADGADFMQALQIAASLAATSGHVYVTGDGSTSGAEICATNIAANPAFVILAPGEDRNGNGLTVDGVNSGLLPLPTTSRCFSSPTRALDTGFDDRSIAIGFYAMMAKLNQ